LEANYLPGGCCSSYFRKGFVFETGATTLMGFDPGQPAAILFESLGLDLERKEIEPAMTVWLTVNG
jgi:phytoene dehydrogenase-like protein